MVREIGENRGLVIAEDIKSAVNKILSTFNSEAERLKFLSQAFLEEFIEKATKKIKEGEEVTEELKSVLDDRTLYFSLIMDSLTSEYLDKEKHSEFVSELEKFVGEKDYYTQNIMLIDFYKKIEQYKKENQSKTSETIINSPLKQASAVKKHKVNFMNQDFLVEDMSRVDAPVLPKFSILQGADIITNNSLLQQIQVSPALNEQKVIQQDSIVRKNSKKPSQKQVIVAQRLINLNDLEDRSTGIVLLNDDIRKQYSDVAVKVENNIALNEAEKKLTERVYKQYTSNDKKLSEVNKDLRGMSVSRNFDLETGLIKDVTVKHFGLRPGEEVNVQVTKNTVLTFTVNKEKEIDFSNARVRAFEYLANKEIKYKETKDITPEIALSRANLRGFAVNGVDVLDKVLNKTQEIESEIVPEVSVPNRRAYIKQVLDKHRVTQSFNMRAVPSGAMAASMA